MGNRTLPCGCLLNSDKNGGVSPCPGGYGPYFGSQEQVTKHDKAWNEYKDTNDYHEFEQELIANN